MQIIRRRQDGEQKGELYLKKSKLSKNSRSINLKNTKYKCKSYKKKYKQKQSSNDMRERKYYKHSQGSLKGLNKTQIQKKAGNQTMGATEKQRATHEGKTI